MQAGDVAVTYADRNALETDDWLHPEEMGTRKS